MQILNHKIIGIDYRPSPNYSKVDIIPRFIVMHYTASLRIEPSVEWMTNSKSKVSSHLVIGRDGKIIQLVDFNKRAWHAGPSKSQGYSGLNSHSIGIELINAGPMTLQGRDIIDVYGRTTGLDINALESIGREYWLPYSESQLNALEEVTEALVDTYPSIFDCVGHEEIDTRGKKRDPGPLFPMPRYDRIVSSRNGDFFVHNTTSKLNVRKSPSGSLSKNGPLLKGTVVKEIDKKGDWVYVNVGGRNIGYVHSSFLRRIR